jgi:hypothetical protein
MQEYLFVKYPVTRQVLVDGVDQGKTGTLISLEPGMHTVRGKAFRGFGRWSFSKRAFSDTTGDVRERGNRCSQVHCVAVAEPKTLASSIAPFCPTCADGEHEKQFQRCAHRGCALYS